MPKISYIQIPLIVKKCIFIDYKSIFISMKKGLFLAFILCLLSVSTFFAQQNKAFTKDIIPDSPEKNITDKHIRNPNAVSVVVDGVTIDKRAAKYYLSEDLQGLSAEKAKKINFLYLDSYELKTSQTDLGSICKEKIKNNFELGPYNHLRKNNERVTVPVEFENCSFSISLYSWEEMK